MFPKGDKNKKIEYPESLDPETKKNLGQLESEASKRKVWAGLFIVLAGIVLLYCSNQGGISELSWNEFGLKTPYPGLIVIVLGGLLIWKSSIDIKVK